MYYTPVVFTDEQLLTELIARDGTVLDNFVTSANQQDCYTLVLHMHITPGNILLIGSILVLISVAASRSTSRFGVPTLILFLIIGALAGSEGIGGIHFDNPEMAQVIGITALVFILYSGGLD